MSERTAIQRAAAAQDELHELAGALQDAAAMRRDAVIELHDEHGWSLAQIAEQLDVTRSAVQKMLR